MGPIGCLTRGAPQKRPIPVFLRGGVGIDCGAAGEHIRNEMACVGTRVGVVHLRYERQERSDRN